MIYTEIQDDRQTSQETSFDKSDRPLCRYPGCQTFVQIALFHTVFKINAVLHLTQKFKMTDKNGGKRVLTKSDSSLFGYPGCQNFVKITLSHTVFKIHAVLRFTQKLKMATKIGT